MAEIIEALNGRGIDFTILAEEAGQPDADPFDPFFFVIQFFNAPLSAPGANALSG